MRAGRLFVLALLASVAMPSGLASAPVNHDAAQSMDAQEVVDLAADPTGRFAVSVVAVAATSGLPTCPLGLTCSPGASHKDVYACDFGASSQGCVSVSHPTSAHAGATSNAQAVDAVSFGVTGGLSTYYAIAGPGDLMSLWSSSGATPLFEKYAPDSNTMNMLAVALSPDGSRVFFAGNATGASAGTLYQYDSSGNKVWGFGLLDGQDSPTHATSMAFARNGGRLVIGTPAGLELLAPSDDAPKDRRPFHFFNTTPVTDVAVSADGLVVAAATDGYTYFLRIDPSGEAQRPVFSRNTGSATAVALSQDGELFASAAGSKISFFRALHNSAIAEFLGDYTASAPVTDLAYDSTGRILVAAAGGSVLGFTPGHTAPAWSFDATARGLDAPLRKVRVSDGWFDGSRHVDFDSSRLIVSGRTKIMAFDMATGATATSLVASGATLVPGVSSPFQVQLTNAGSLAGNYSFVVQPPISSVATPWTTTNAPAVALEPDATTTASFNVTAPLGQTPGSYALTVEVHAQGRVGKAACGASSDTVACVTISFAIPRSISLAISGPEDRRLLRQGTEDTIALQVTNTGNAEGLVNLTATQTLSRGSPWNARFTPSAQLRIAPGATESVSLVIDAPNDAVSGDKNVVTVIAKEGDAASATKSFTAYVDAQFGSELTASNNSAQLAPGEVRTIPVSVRNTGNTEDTFNVTYSLSPSSASNDWRIILDHETLTVPLGQVRQVGVTIRPLVAEPREATLTINTLSQGNPNAPAGSYVIALFPKATVTTPASKSNFLPDLAPVWVVGLLAAAAFARRFGGRR